MLAEYLAAMYAAGWHDGRQSSLSLTEAVQQRRPLLEHTIVQATHALREAGSVPSPTPAATDETFRLAAATLAQEVLASKQNVGRYLRALATDTLKIANQAAAGARQPTALPEDVQIVKIMAHSERAIGYSYADTRPDVAAEYERRARALFAAATALRNVAPVLRMVCSRCGTDCQDELCVDGSADTHTPVAAPPLSREALETLISDESWTVMRYHALDAALIQWNQLKRAMRSPTWPVTSSAREAEPT